VKRLAYLLTATFMFACLLSAVLVRAAGSVDMPPAWQAPTAMALKRVGAIDSAQHEPNFLSNLSCGQMSYRRPNSSTMETGCFQQTAFGMMDIDNGVVVFNGTDEGLPLLSYLANQGLVPWPQAVSLLTMDAASTGGTYIGMYRNPLNSVKDQRDSLSRLIAKQLTAPADLSLKDPSGQPLVVNAQTLAFSDNGSWLAVETLNGSFVRINLATLEVVAFAPAFGTTGSPGLLDSQVAVSSDGRYVAIDNDAASALRVYDLTTCSGVVAGLQPQKCAFYDYLPFVRQQIDGFHAIRHLRFVNNGLLSFDARTDRPDGGSVYELAPGDSIKSLIDYLALGDSYTSGEGAFNYLSGTDTTDNMCHLSANSYPLLLTRALFGNGGHSVACSGAVINDVGSTSPGYRGQVRGVAAFDQLQKEQAGLLDSIMAGYLPGYVAQQRFVQQYQPAVITVLVGGNNIGFGDIIKNCVMPHIGLHSGNNTCYGTYEDRLELTKLIDRTVPHWTMLYKQLAAEAPGTRLYALGYPQIAATHGNCGLNAHLNEGELEFAQELIDYLNTSIRQAAINGGVTYVDISQALAGHRLCEAANYDVAVNGLTAGTDSGVLGIGVFGKESYHPNTLGQSLIEQAILEQTHNLAASQDTAAGNNGQAILDAPKTGRTINTVVPDDGLTNEVRRAGESAAIQASGTRDGLKANTVYFVRLDGANGPMVGAVLSNDKGDVSGTVTLPASTQTGGHTIDITGQGQAGEPVDVTQPIYVPAGSSDSDGDGIADTVDSCPEAVNSGQDIDRDGVDDTCDGLINPPLAVGQGGSNGPDNNLGSQPVTIVTSFSLNSYQNNRATASLPVGQNSIITSGTGRISGSVMTKSVAVLATAFKRPEPPSGYGQSGATKPLKRLRVINWLSWAIVLVIFVLALLIAYLNRLISRRARDIYT
jgi:hypothetical protein